jgi:CRP-like cAMP-binding protein
MIMTFDFDGIGAAIFASQKGACALPGLASVVMRTVPAETAYLRLAKALLARASGFHQCAPETIEALVNSGEIHRVPHGTWVCRRDDAFQELCLIVEGVLESSLCIDSGQRHLVAYSAAGDILGFVCCVDQLPVPHDFRAHTDAILLRVPLAAIQRLRGLDPALSRAFEIQLAARTRQFYDRLTEALLLPFEARLARMLLELVVKFGVERDSKTVIVLRIPQNDLADLLGASRQRVNQALREFEREGLLTLGRSSIQAIDVARLTGLAGSTRPRIT